MIKSPAKILKLWHKVCDRFGPEDAAAKKDDKKKAPGAKEKAAEKQSEKIGKGLTVLRNVAKDGVKAPSQVKRFEGVRGKALRLMKLHCKALKPTLSNLQDQTKYRKNVRQLTVVVAALDPALVDAADEGEIDLSALLGVDDSKLDEALDDPSLAVGDGDDISFDDEAEPNETEHEETATPPQAPPKPPPAANPQVAFLARLNKLMPDITKAKEEKTPVGQEIAVRFSEMQLLARKKDFAQADALLTKIEQQLKGQGHGPPPALAGWQAAVAKAVGELKTVAAQVASSGHAESKVALIEVNMVMKKLDPNLVAAAQVTLLESFLQANPVVADVCDLAFDLRSPLLQALAALKPQLPA